MKRTTLLRIIRTLPEHLPISDQIPWPENYDSHHEHWVRWVGDMDTAGFYGRKRPAPDDARAIYNRIQNAGMLVWLAEAAGVRSAMIESVVTYATLKRPLATRCALIRDRLPWGIVENALQRLP